jgi:hypothetical protein
MCNGFEECINNTDEYFVKTLERLCKIVGEIQRRSLFSANEEINDIPPENIK